jgi:hypothetical protein
MPSVADMRTLASQLKYAGQHPERTPLSEFTLLMCQLLLMQAELLEELANERETRQEDSNR